MKEKPYLRAFREAKSRSAGKWTYHILRNPTLTGLSHGINESSSQPHSTNFTVNNICLSKAVIPPSYFPTKTFADIFPYYVWTNNPTIGDDCKRENNRPVAFFFFINSVSKFFLYYTYSFYVPPATQFSINSSDETSVLHATSLTKCSFLWSFKYGPEPIHCQCRKKCITGCNVTTHYPTLHLQTTIPIPIPI